jgi:TetR/AcrR family fatty acid metabolism transcriptional regulator
LNNEKRNQIIDAAEQVVAKNGFNKSSISEIADRANVSVSMIYQFFKSKDDLLFSIPEKRVKEIISLLNEHLAGISNPESQLGKFVWFHLHYNDIHRSYANILLLECRSNKAFYNSETYSLVVDYARKLLNILENGVNEGVFRNDIEMYIVRDIILGALDFENLTCFVANEIKESVPDLNDIMLLILPMIMSKSTTKTATGNKYENILTSAEHIFSEKGFGKTTISEIAKTAGVGEGTVYEYFNNKEDLLFAIPDRRFKDNLKHFEDAFEFRTPLRKLRRLIRIYFSLFLTDRNFLKIFVLQIQYNERFYNSKVYEGFRAYFEIIENIIIDGKNKNQFRKDVNPRVFRNIFLGAFNHMALRWFILNNKRNVDMIKEIDHVVDLFSSAVLIDNSKH